MTGYNLPVAKSDLDPLQQILPIYTLRRSARAKHVRLNVTPTEGLVVVVPRDFDSGGLSSILLEKQAWIDKALLWAEEQRSSASRIRRHRMPGVIFLKSIGETWDVAYSITASQRLTVREGGGDTLSVRGPVGDAAACRAALKRWLMRKARKSIVPVLDRLSLETGLAYKRPMVGNQRTLWASCSSGLTISLNQKLLFLPRRLMEYTLLHELCHTVHLDHSLRFWSLVGSFEPRFRQLDRELKGAEKYVPAWAQ